MGTPDVPEWPPVVGLEGFYEVSNTGLVRSIPRWDGRARRRGIGRFDPYAVPGSAVPAILDGADRATAHKQAVDEIRAYCTTVAAEGTHPQQLIVGDIRRILQHHGLT